MWVPSSVPPRGFKCQVYHFLFRFDSNNDRFRNIYLRLRHVTSLSTSSCNWCPLKFSNCLHLKLFLQHGNLDGFSDGLKPSTWAPIHSVYWNLKFATSFESSVRRVQTKNSWIIFPSLHNVSSMQGLPLGTWDMRASTISCLAYLESTHRATWSIWCE